LHLDASAEVFYRNFLNVLAETARAMENRIAKGIDKLSYV
jgi:hypothetical protein